jgi:large subunit ribosomal protein L24
MPKRLKIRKGDQVEVITGKDRGKRGKVLRVDYQRERVVVEHVNMVKRHTRANPTAGSTGGIIEREAPIHVSNLMVVSPDSGQRSRIGFERLEDGSKVRVAKVDGATLDQ